MTSITKEQALKNFVDYIGKVNFNMMKGNWHANNFRENFSEFFEDKEAGEKLMEALNELNFLLPDKPAETRYVNIFYEGDLDVLPNVYRIERDETV